MLRTPKIQLALILLRLEQARYPNTKVGMYNSKRVVSGLLKEHWVDLELKWKNR